MKSINFFVKREDIMKKTSLMAAAVISIAAIITGCGSTSTVTKSDFKGDAAVMAKTNKTIIDYQGATFGTPVPQWVISVAEGNYTVEALKKQIPGIEGKKPFVTLARGDNLDFVREWTNTTRIETVVGDEMQRIVGKAVSASQTGSTKYVGDQQSATVLEQKLNMYKEAVSAVELNGLESITEYWVKVNLAPTDDEIAAAEASATREAKKAGGSKEDIADRKAEIMANYIKENSKKYYEYYAVWGMKQELYDIQIKKAMESVEDNTDEGKALKSSLSLKLQSMMISSNDSSVNDAAEGQIGE